MYVSTGIPQAGFEGEHYLPSPEAMRAFMDDAQPPEPSGKYCVLKPLTQHTVPPLVIIFFARPEVLTGLFSLVSYAAGHHQAVVSPFGSACANIIAWPLAYQAKGIERAVLGGFRPVGAKIFEGGRTDLGHSAAIVPQNAGCPRRFGPAPPYLAEHAQKSTAQPPCLGRATQGRHKRGLSGPSP
ncbi:MAG: DUF169 domain-containing protein [Desulfobulbaceae bacterium]|jgi:hypothetical protein|nr:DUF169 domain-containing protein [Desulfobulbaceae bacterium]